MRELNVYVTTATNLSVDVDALKEEFFDVWQETCDDGEGDEEFICRMIELEGVDYLIESEYCLSHDELSPIIDVSED